MNWRWISARGLLAVLLVLLLGVGGCGGSSSSRVDGQSANTSTRLAGSLSEVSPPATLQELHQALDRYQPQVNILSPRPDQVLQDNQVTVEFQVQNLPLFQNEEFGLGPHLHVILDNEPYRAVYDVSQPLVLEDVSPGTHTLRVFASRPWHESFKNEGAYAQRSFHVFTQTPDNRPDPSQPLLTYSRPKGSYGAEPILLDFYLTNAPLHLVAQERPDDDIVDWQIRCTVNGESFVFDRWQPIYLRGLKPGQNWVKLELLDENGNLFPNAYNGTVRLITYEPNGNDTLSKLVRGELSAEKVRGIVDPTYQPQPTIAPVPTPAPSPAPVPTLVPEPENLEDLDLDIEEEAPAIAPLEEPAPGELEVPAALEAPEPEAPNGLETPQPAAPKSGGFFDRFRRGKEPAVTPAPEQSSPLPLPEVLPEVLPDLLEEDSLPGEASETEDLPMVEEETGVEPLLEPEPEPIFEPSLKAEPKPFFERFRRRSAQPDTALPTPKTLPEVLDEPNVDAALEPLPESEAVDQPEEAIAPVDFEEPTAEPTSPSDSTPAEPLSPRLQNLLKRFRSSQETQAGDRPMTPEDTLPEIIEAPLPTADESGAALDLPTAAQTPVPQRSTAPFSEQPAL